MIQYRQLPPTLGDSEPLGHSQRSGDTRPIVQGGQEVRAARRGPEVLGGHAVRGDLVANGAEGLQGLQGLLERVIKAKGGHSAHENSVQKSVGRINVNIETLC